MDTPHAVERRESPPTHLPGGRRYKEDPDIREPHERGMLAIGDELHRLMERRGWSVRQLAKVAGVNETTVQAVLTNDTDPCYSTVIRLFIPFGRHAVFSLVASNGSLVTPGYNPTKHAAPAAN